MKNIAVCWGVTPYVLVDILKLLRNLLLPSSGYQKKESSILKTRAAHYCANLVSIFQIVCSIVPHFKFVTVEHVTCIIVLKKLGWRNLKFWQWKLTAEKVTPFEFLMSNFRIYCPNFRNSNVLHNRTAIDSDLRNICGTKFSLRPCWSYGTPSW